MIYDAFRSEMISIPLLSRNFTQRFRAIFLTAILLSLAMPASSDDRRGRSVTFVHATDPHLFVPASQDPDQKKKATGELQQELDKTALTDMFQRLKELSGPAGAPTFLVLTGDLGVDPCDISKAAATQPAPASPPPAGQAKEAPKESAAPKPCVADETKRNDEIQRLAQALGSSPLKEIYLVAGNNDVAHEDADGDSLGYFNKLIAEVQTKLTDGKTGVQLYNLTACYATTGASSSCYADIPNTSYRLIGFPSYSFKNVGGKSTNNDAQAAQFATFRTLLDQARQSGKKVLILSHVPEMDDPFTLAQERYAAKKTDDPNDKDPKNPRSPTSTWNVTTKILNDWKDVLASDTVAAVLAGHLHDSHKEIYRPPYAWSSDGDYRLGFRKLFLAPPLAVKKQDTSPIQARGFSLMTVSPDRIHEVLYWYNQETHEFTADAHFDPFGKGNRRWLRWPLQVLRSMWQLDGGNSGLRLAILLIALLTAYLTVVAIWNIPVVDNPLAPKTGEQKSPTDSPYATDFGKTVIAGLTGLAVTEVAKSLGGDQSNDSRWLYIIWFVFFFFVLLVGLSLARAVAEGVRAVVIIPRYPLARPAQPQVDIKAVSPLQFYRWASYWWMRFVHWFFSLRVPLLTTFDTFINLIQGKNQTMTRVFSDTIIDQQRNSIRVAHAIRKDLTKLIEQKLIERSGAASVQSRVRVGISVLSADQSSVFYISQSPGSSKKPFPKRSVAWLSVFTGEIRWFRSSYHSMTDHIVLLDNGSGAIADDVKTIYLSSYYQDRNADYQAFVMFPFPWPQRGFGSDYVKGAVHISFRAEDDFVKIWRDPTGTDAEHPMLARFQADPATNEQYWTYPATDSILNEWGDREVRAALINSLGVLGELLRKFNETIYRSYIEPGQAD